MITNFIFALTIIIIGLLFGRGLRILLDKGKISSATKMHKILKGCTMTALLLINPLIIMGAFWFVQLDDMKLTLIPILGGLTLALGGALALVAARLYRLNRMQTGAMFASGTFTNLGSFGALFCFVFLGEESLVFVAMFRLLEDLIYYTVGFPIAQSYGERQGTDKGQSPVKKILTNPFIIVTFTAITIGGILNLSSWERPAVYGDLNSFLVPLFTILLVVPTGFNMRITAVRGYLKEGLTIAVIKFILVPITIVCLAVLFNLNSLYDGMVLKVLILLAAMPPGFTSLVPPQLFKLDMDLANSSWFINTVLLILVLPILYFLVVYL